MWKHDQYTGRRYVGEYADGMFTLTFNGVDGFMHKIYYASASEARERGWVKIR